MSSYIHYYVNNNAQSNGDHEVHKEGCTFFPSNHTYLGYYTNCRGAVQKARGYHTQVNGCYFCSKECHTS